MWVIDGIVLYRECSSAIVNNYKNNAPCDLVHAELSKKQPFSVIFKKHGVAGASRARGLHSCAPVKLSVHGGY